MSLDIKTMSVESLKALAYDQLVALESVQKNLSVINTEIASRNNPPVPPVPPTVEEKESTASES